MVYLRLFPEWCLGMDTLRGQHARLQGQYAVLNESTRRLNIKNRDLQDTVDAAHQRHIQDHAAIAEVAGQRWSAVAALMGGIEQLQHKWQDESPPQHGRGLGPGSIASKLTAVHINELGGLKRSIQRQFGVHPSQAKKTAAEILGRKPLGRISQDTTNKETT